MFRALGESVEGLLHLIDARCLHQFERLFAELARLRRIESVSPPSSKDTQDYTTLLAARKVTADEEDPKGGTRPQGDSPIGGSAVRS